MYFVCVPRDFEDYILVSVQDFGTGINPEHAERLFDAFFTTKSDGIGLGLSICRSIVESDGGRLSVFPVHPHGSVFQVMLPIGEADAETLGLKTEKPTNRSSVKNVSER